MRFIHGLMLCPLLAFAETDSEAIEVLKNQVGYINQQQYSQQIQSLEQEVQSLRGDIEQLRYQLSQFKQDKPSSTQVGQNDQLLYKSAVDALQKKQYADAISKFKKLIHEMPKSTLVPNAYYWLGEMVLLYNRYTPAMQNFEYLLQNYPQHAKVPDALLKMSVAEVETGRYDVAITHLQRIVDQYPRSTAAHMAKLQLSRLQQKDTKNS